MNDVQTIDERERELAELVRAEVPDPAFPLVVKTPGVCGGSARLARTRMAVWLLEELRRNGWSLQSIFSNFPDMTPVDIAQAWGYAAAHKPEIDQDIRENEEAMRE